MTDFRSKIRSKLHDDATYDCCDGLSEALDEVHRLGQENTRLLGLIQGALDSLAQGDAGSAEMILEWAESPEAQDEALEYIMEAMERANAD